MGDLTEQPGGAWHRQRAALSDQPMKALAGDVLHRDVVNALALVDLTGPRQVRVGDALRHLHLAAEASQEAILLARLTRRQHLQRQQLAGALIASQIDSPHSTAADRREHLERPEHQSDAGAVEQLASLE